MTDRLHVNPAELRGASSAWHAEAFELAAVPPALDVSGGWPTMIAAAGVTGAAQAATADLHTRIATTAGATQIAATSYDANESDAVDAIKNVISRATIAARDNT